MSKGTGKTGFHITHGPASILIRGEAIDANPHRHHALQVTIALQGRFRLACGGEQLEARGALTAPDVTHLLDGTGGRQAVLLIEPEHTFARAIMDWWLQERAFTLLPDETARRLAEMLNSTGPLNDAAAGMTRILVSSLPSLPEMDSRISALLDHMRAMPQKNAPLEKLAERAGLSSSRLAHLFKEQTGAPIRRYLLWLKLNDAMRQALSGASLTEAAHHAGFADSAHFSRTAAATFGVNPRAIVRDSRFVQAARKRTA